MFNKNKTHIENKAFMVEPFRVRQLTNVMS